jgi:hypothetical protein
MDHDEAKARYAELVATIDDAELEPKATIRPTK